MKTSKASAAFLTKFSSFISKFKQSSTINVAHQQIRKLLSQYKWSDIAIPFGSKMDSCDQLSDKQKKQYVKIYITLIDVYGQEIILEQYDRVVDSIARKSAGVSDVIGHLCRNLLKRIYPTQNIGNYIKHLFLVFQRHIQLPKIIKQIVQSFDSQIIAPFQSQIIGMINQKINTNPKNQIRSQYLQAILAMILSLQSKFYEENITQQIVSKNLKNQQWTVRKHCVDISYALLVIKTQINTYLHQSVLELKYDKIKHVRDSVNNYTTLYRQIYGEQKQKQKPKQRQPISRKAVPVAPKQNKNIQQRQRRTITSRSPIIPQRFNKPNQQTKNNPKSLQKSIRNTNRNQQFFQNAGTKDVIKLPQSKSYVFQQKQRNRVLSPKQRIKQSKSFTANVILHQQQKQQKQVERDGNGKEESSNFNSINFQQYLKHRPKQDNYLVFSSDEKKQRNQNTLGQRIMSSFNPLDKMGVSPKSGPKIKQQTRTQNKKTTQQIPPPSRTIQSKLTYQSSTQQLALQLKKQLQNVQSKLQNFSYSVLQKLTNLQKRVQNLQKQNKKQKQPHHYIQQMSLSSLQKDMKDIRNQTNSYLQQSFDNKFNQIMNKSNNKYSKQEKYQNQKQQKQVSSQLITQRQRQKQKISKNSNISSSMPGQSNLNQKIQKSLKQNNWDQAFSLAIANNSRPAILQLLTYYQIPKDKLVQDCLFAQLRRNLSNWVVLKWLINYIQQTYIPIDKLSKLINDLKKTQQIVQSRQDMKENQIRNYNMLKTLLLNQLNARLKEQSEGQSDRSKSASVEGFNFMGKTMF